MSKTGSQLIRDSGLSPLNHFNGNTDDLLDVLSDPIRRNVLTYPHDEDSDVVELAELADWVLAQDTNNLDYQQESMEIALHHTHLPKLAASGVIDYDSQSNTVRYHGQTELGHQIALVDEMVGDLS